MKCGVLLASHGQFAQAALEAAEMLAGSQTNVEVCCLVANQSADSFKASVEEAYTKLAQDSDLVVALCDVQGGTPYNTLNYLMLSGNSMLAFTGLSLPVLMEVLLSRDCVETPEELADVVRATHSQALVQLECPVACDASDDDLDL